MDINTNIDKFTVSKLYNITDHVFKHANCVDIDLNNLNDKFGFNFPFSSINKNKISIDSVRCATGYLYKYFDISILQIDPTKKILLIDALNVINNIFILKNLLFMNEIGKLELTPLDRHIIFYRMYFIFHKHNRRDHEYDKIQTDKELIELLGIFDEDKLINLFKLIKNASKISNIDDNLKKDFKAKNHLTLHGFSTQINFYLIQYILPKFLNTSLTNYNIYICAPNYSIFSNYNFNYIENTSSNRIYFISIPCFKNIVQKDSCEKSDVDDFVIIYLYSYFNSIIQPIKPYVPPNLIIWSYDRYSWYPKIKVMNMRFIHDKQNQTIDFIPFYNNSILYYDVLSENTLETLIDTNPQTNPQTNQETNPQTYPQTNPQTYQEIINSFNGLEYIITDITTLLGYYKINFGSKQERFINAINYLYTYRENICQINDKKKIVIDVINLYLNLNFLKKLQLYNKLTEIQKEFLNERIRIFNENPISKEKLLDNSQIHFFSGILFNIINHLFNNFDIYLVFKSDQMSYDEISNKNFNQSINNNIIKFICIQDESTLYNSFANGNVTFATFFLYYYLWTKDPNTILWSYNSFNYDWINPDILCEHPSKTYKLVSNFIPGKGIVSEVEIVPIFPFTKSKLCYATKHTPCVLSNIDEQFCTYFDILK